jgi:hypothetical protein
MNRDIVMGLIAPSETPAGSLTVAQNVPVSNGIVVGAHDLIIIVVLGTLTSYVLLANDVGTLRPIVMLAMALFLDKYVKHSMTPVDRDKLEAAWLLRWKEALGNPSRLPRKVMKAYLDYMDMSTDVLDNQMDWDSWPEDDEVDDFGLDVPSEHPQTL